MSKFGGGMVYERGAPATGATTLSGLTDVTISGPADGEVLTYNATSGKWENVAPGGGLWTQGTGEIYPTSTTDTVNVPQAGVSFENPPGVYGNNGIIVTSLPQGGAPSAPEIRLVDGLAAVAGLGHNGSTYFFSDYSIFSVNNPSGTDTIDFACKGIYSMYHYENPSIQIQAATLTGSGGTTAMTWYNGLVDATTGFAIGGTSGVSGTFTTADVPPYTVTVSGGIITSIV
jgi:hypothetical protein